MSSTASLVCLIFGAWLIIGLYAAPDDVEDPCRPDSHALLSSASRNVARGSRYRSMSSARCDQLLHGWKEQWYRFTGEAGSRMATECPKGYSCGTWASLWMKGTLPTVEEGVVERNICGSYRGNCCMQKDPIISVKNCGDFYVYYLRSTYFCSAYCGTDDV
ncbi:pancreatic secretory granule membrane major glycoprotein GP2-like [Lingula anatina]|uniref:Pancreatic secretory granule membrane major glycoprotein GP2-like n=1 Tax=Lingula anatina TaxID=7574 RepID=A0A1S3K2I8_LINAN|nr:pancreatic secretory granule membrane major glycoprotein GP2-like [Lingula anatina]|eukprot:XP_013416609.2 pancreatic secretory granule membrane major glycoprotein GP2-like [Lingula anatina]